MLFSILLLLTNTFVSASNNHHHIFQLNNNITADYLCEYSNLTRYSTGLNQTLMLNTIY